MPESDEILAAAQAAASPSAVREAGGLASERDVPVAGTSAPAAAAAASPDAGAAPNGVAPASDGTGLAAQLAAMEQRLVSRIEGLALQSTDPEIRELAAVEALGAEVKKRHAARRKQAETDERKRISELADQLTGTRLNEAGEITDETQVRQARPPHPPAPGEPGVEVLDPGTQVQALDLQGAFARLDALENQGTFTTVRKAFTRGRRRSERQTKDGKAKDSKSEDKS
jgi:hypothetical protein